MMREETTMKTPPIAITGATGRLGGRVARSLAQLGVAQRLIVRDAGRAPALPRAEVSVASYGDREPLARALDGVETLLFVSGGESRTRLAQHFTLVDTAAACGVRHVVYTSFFGASPDATFTLVRDHWATEQRLREAGLSFTFLRDNLYLDFFPLMMGDDGVIRGPAGRGRVAAVAQDDIADVAVAVLRDPGAHAGATYDLTGPAALTLDEVASVLSRHVGREVRYEEESLDEAYRSRARYDVERWQLDAWVSTYTAIAAGELARVTGDVARVAGHAPIGLEEVLERGRGR
jgi:NAD(P)H dehydrogenase (quinone)